MFVKRKGAADLALTSVCVWCDFRVLGLGILHGSGALKNFGVRAMDIGALGDDTRDVAGRLSLPVPSTYNGGKSGPGTSKHTFSCLRLLQSGYLTELKAELSQLKMKTWPSLWTLEIQTFRHLGRQ